MRFFSLLGGLCLSHKLYEPEIIISRAIEQGVFHLFPCGRASPLARPGGGPLSF
jgi:hypothetical protein